MQYNSNMSANKMVVNNITINTYNVTAEKETEVYFHNEAERAVAVVEKLFCTSKEQNLPNYLMSNEVL
jgi:hypothetical protein